MGIGILGDLRLKLEFFADRTLTVEAKMSFDGHDPRALSNELLDVAAIHRKPLTIMQLLKLAYFAHGWTLAQLGYPLCREEPEVWQYGPVFPTMYRSFPGAGSSVIKTRIKDIFGISYEEKFERKEREILHDVITTYGSMHAYELSALTHLNGSPWKKISDERKFYSAIPNKLTQEYFVSLKSKTH